jgi:Zn-dependent protease
MHPDIGLALLNVALLWLLTTPHEYAHALVATRLGDDTPRLQGRLTLNPLAHIDWLGTTILPALTSLFGGGFLGWGKPVSTNPAKLRGGLNGLALVALAGPASNVIFAVILGAVARATLTSAPALSHFAGRGVYLSLYLAIFNMLPVPPLDGSKLLLAARIPPVVYNELARAGFLLLIFAVSFSGLGQWMSHWSYQGALEIFGLFH